MFSPKIYIDINVKMTQVIKTLTIPAHIEAQCLCRRVSRVLSNSEYPVIAVLKAIIHGMNMATRNTSINKVKNATRRMEPITPVKIEYANLFIRSPLATFCQKIACVCYLRHRSYRLNKLGLQTGFFALNCTSSGTFYYSSAHFNSRQASYMPPIVQKRNKSKQIQFMK